MEATNNPTMKPILLEIADWHTAQSIAYAGLMAFADEAGNAELRECYAKLSTMHQEFADAIRGQELL